MSGIVGGIVGGNNGGATPESAILVWDVFIDANGTILSSHTPDIDAVGAGWQVLNGGYEINSHKCVSSQNAPAGIATNMAAIDCGQSDCVISHTFNSNYTGGTDNAGLAFRIVDKDNFWLFASNGPTKIDLHKIVAGAATLVGTINGATVRSGAIHEVTLNGSLITCRTFGAGTDITLTTTDTQFLTATKHGMRVYEGLPSYRAEIDKFRIERL